MKRVIRLSVIFILLSTFGSYSQTIWALKGGGGTSWIIYPKVFLVDETDPDNVWEVAPGKNNISFYVGGAAIIPLSKHWLFIPEANLNYLSGEITVTSIQLNAVSRRVQSYTRLELPLLFAVKSSDKFWFTFGPSVFFTLHDNQGFEKAVEELTAIDNVNSKRTIGLRMRLGAALTLSEKMFLEIKFDYDIGSKFAFESDTYEVRLAMQSITAGLGWTISK